MQELYEEALPAFDVLGKKSFFLGEVGDGAKMKLVVNMVMGRYFSSRFFSSILLNFKVQMWINSKREKVWINSIIKHLLYNCLYISYLFL